MGLPQAAETLHECNEKLGQLRSMLPRPGQGVALDPSFERSVLQTLDQARKAALMQDVGDSQRVSFEVERLKVATHSIESFIDHASISSANLAEVDDTYQVLKAIEHETTLILQLFQDIQSLVDEQNKPVTTLADEASHVYVQLSGAEEETSRYAQTHLKGRQRYCCLLFILLVVFAALLGSFLV